MSSLIGKVNAGSCVVGRRPKWMNSFAPPASKRSIWKSISGECSPSQSHDARSLNYRVHVSRLKAFTVAAELSVLFLVVYSGCNWITGQRSHVGAFFDWFRGVDLPFNLFPSLHAALLLLLVDVYARNLRGIFLLAVMSWFLLIALSPLLTYQHHVIDIVGGFVLAGYCSYLFREPTLTPPVIANRRIGSYYAAGAAVVLIMGGIFWPWGVLLLWPAIALGIVAIAYFRAGPIVFRKTEGKLPWSTRFVLAPCLLGQYLSLLYYRNQCRSWDKVTPQIWIGGKLGCRSANKR